MEAFIFKHKFTYWSNQNKKGMDYLNPYYFHAYVKVKEAKLEAFEYNSMCQSEKS